MKRNELACERAKELLEFDLDGELAEAERIALRGHLRDCEPCRAWQASLRSEFALIASLPQVVEPQGFTHQVMSRLRVHGKRQKAKGKREQPMPGFGWRALAYGIASVIAVCAIWLAVRPGSRQVVQRPSTRKGPMIVKNQPAPDNEHTAAITPELFPVVPPSARPATTPRPARVAHVRHTRSTVAATRRTASTAPAARATEPPTDYMQLGENYEREGMLDEALAAYQQADAQSPSLGTSLAVARVHDKLGQTEEAMETYVAAAFADWSEEPSNGNTEG